MTTEDDQIAAAHKMWQALYDVGLSPEEAQQVMASGPFSQSIAIKGLIRGLLDVSEELAEEVLGEPTLNSNSEHCQRDIVALFDAGIPPQAAAIFLAGAYDMDVLTSSLNTIIGEADAA